MTIDLIERLRLGDGTSPDHLLLLEAADALEKSVECMCGICKLGHQRKPLTDKQIEEIAEGYLVDYRIPAGCAWNFAREIEAAHGIKETEK